MIYLETNTSQQYTKWSKDNQMLKHPLEVSDDNPPHILAVFWSSLFPFYFHLPNGSLTWENVEMTYDRTRLEQADYVFIHFRSLRTMELPTERHPWQKWVLYTMESPIHDGLLKLSPQQLSKIIDLFNFTSHYSQHSLIRSPYGTCFYIKDSVIKYHVSDMNKTGSVAWAVSNCQTSSERENYVNNLSKHIKVDIFGGCGLLQQPKIGFDTVLQTYKFYLAFENSFCEDYATEKFYKIYTKPDLLVIPVAMGLTSYGSIFPSGSYIDIRDYTSPSHLAKYLHYLDKNNTAFMEYFTARNNYRCYHSYVAHRAIANDLNRLRNVQNMVNMSQLENIFGERNCLSAFEYYQRYNISL